MINTKPHYIRDNVRVMYHQLSKMWRIEVQKVNQWYHVSDFYTKKSAINWARNKDNVSLNYLRFEDF